MLLLDYWPLLLLDDKLSDVQTSDLQLLYVEALDPAPLYSQRPDRQSADDQCPEGTRSHSQSPDGPSPDCHPSYRHPLEGRLPARGRMVLPLYRPLSHDPPSLSIISLVLRSSQSRPQGPPSPKPKTPTACAPKPMPQPSSGQ